MGVESENDRTHPHRPIRVAIAEDTYLLREALEMILERAPTVELVRSCVDRDSLLAAVAHDDPDVVVTDIRMPPTDTDEGIRVAHALRRSHPHIGVIVLSQFAEPAYVIALLDSGSDGRAYLLKERVGHSDQLISAIETVAAGGSVVDPKVVEVLVRARTIDSHSGVSELTAREREVLGEVAQGKSNAAIAEALVLTKRGVERHINSIFMKLDLGAPQSVDRRVKAALVYLAGGGSSAPA